MIAHRDDEGKPVFCHVIPVEILKHLAFGIGQHVQTGAGLFRLRVETDFSKNFRESTPIVQSLQFFEQNLGGAGTWEVNFPAPAELTGESLEPVRELTASNAGPDSR